MTTNQGSTTKKTRKLLNEPFDVTYIIRFKGVTRTNGWRMVTPPMIIDKIADVLTHMVMQQNIVEFSIKVDPTPKKEKKAK